jgi:hypothetical protein
VPLASANALSLVTRNVSEVTSLGSTDSSPAGVPQAQEAQARVPDAPRFVQSHQPEAAESVLRQSRREGLVCLFCQLSTSNCGAAANKSHYLRSESHLDAPAEIAHARRDGTTLEPP